MRGLKGKNVLVTGGGSGIGQATAARFLEEGCSVCVLDRSAEAIERVTAELPALTAVLEADVSKIEEVHSAMDEAIEWLKRAPFGDGMELELRPIFDMPEAATES